MIDDHETGTPLPGAFEFTGPAAWYVHSSDRNHIPGVNRPVTIPMERVENRILTIRGHRVMVDTDLAEVYGVPTKRLNEQVKRNADLSSRNTVRLWPPMS